MREQVQDGRIQGYQIRAALEITERFHARGAIAHRRIHPALSEMPCRRILQRKLSCVEGLLPIRNLLKDSGLVSSTSEAMRMIQQGAVRIDGVKVEDTALCLNAGTTGIFQVGKRKFLKILLD